MSRVGFRCLASVIVALFVAGCGRGKPESGSTSVPTPTSRLGSPQRVYGPESLGDPAEMAEAGASRDKWKTTSDRVEAWKIRRAIVADDELAPSATNITIHVQNGQVRVQGNVGSKQEQRAIAAMVEKKTGSVPTDIDLHVVRPAVP